MPNTRPFHVLRGAVAARAVLGLAALLACSLSSTALADDSGPGRYAGSYKFAGTKAQAEAVIDKALDEALAQLNVVMRTMVKKAIKMRPGQRFIDTIVIKTPDGKIGLKMGEFDEVVLDVGKPKTMTQDGRTGKVTHRFSGGKISQELAGDEGKVTNVLTLTKDGKTLHRDVTVTSKRLEKPIRYRLTYKRK